MNRILNLFIFIIYGIDFVKKCTQIFHENMLIVSTICPANKLLNERETKVDNIIKTDADKFNKRR